MWALAEVRGTCSGGSKSQVTTGRHSERVKPSRPMQTHVQVLNKCPTAHVISRILNVVNVCQTLLGDGKVFPRHQFARHTTSFSTIPGTIQSPRPPKDSLLSRTIVRGRCDHSMVGPSPATTSCTSIIMFKANSGSAQQSRIAVRVYDIIFQANNINIW